MRTKDVEYIKKNAEAIIQEVKKEFVDGSYILEKLEKIKKEVERQGTWDNEKKVFKWVCILS